MFRVDFRYSMGGAASFSYWTAEEQAENERAEQRMLSAKDFILDFVYYGIPVRSGKKSWDPSSPLCFEVDPKVIEEAMLGTGEVQKTMLATVPSTVIVNLTQAVDTDSTKESKRHARVCNIALTGAF